MKSNKELATHYLKQLKDNCYDYIIISEFVNSFHQKDYLKTINQEHALGAENKQKVEKYLEDSLNLIIKNN